MRKMFSDGFNSHAHVLIGAAGAIWFPIFAVSILYQVIDGGENMNVDIAENFVGFFIGFLLLKLFPFF